MVLLYDLKRWRNVADVAETCGQKQTCFFTTELMRYVFTNSYLVSRIFLVFFWNVFIAMVHTEATLKGLSKPDLIKLVLQLKSEMNSDIKELISKIETL